MDVDLRQGLVEIETLLERYTASGDPAQITAGEVGERVDALADAAGAAMAPGVVADLTPLMAIGAVGQFYLARGQVLAAGGDDHPDFAQAYSYLRWLVGIAPSVVPPDLRRDLIVEIVEGEADEMVRIAGAAVAQGQETRDLALLDHGVRIHEALVADPELAGERARLMLDLGAAHGARYRVTGQREDLEAAIEVLSGTLKDPSITDDAHEVASTNLSEALRLRSERFGDPADSAAGAP